MVYMWKMGFHRAACKIFLAFSQWSRLEVSVPNLIGYRCPARVVVSGQELVRTWFRLNWDNLPNKLPNSNMAWKKRFKFAWHLDIPKVFLNPFPQKGQTTNFQQIYAATQKLSLFIVKKQIKNPYAPAGFHPNLFCCSLHELQPHRNRGEPPESCLRLSFQLTFTPEQTERIEAQKFFSRDGDRDSNICSLQVENIQIYRYGPAFPGPLLAMVMGHKHIYIYMYIYAYLCIIYHTRAPTLQENGIPKFLLVSGPTGTTNLQDLWIHQWNKHATNSLGMQSGHVPRVSGWKLKCRHHPETRGKTSWWRLWFSASHRRIFVGLCLQISYIKLFCMYTYILCIYIYTIADNDKDKEIYIYIYIYTYICDKVPFQVLKAALRSQSFSTFPIQVREIIANNQLPKPRPRRREVAAGKTQAMMKKHREWGAKSSQGS